MMFECGPDELDFFFYRFLVAVPIMMLCVHHMWFSLQTWICFLCGRSVDEGVSARYNNRFCVLSGRGRSA